MKIGVPREVKTHEYRVGMRPAAVQPLIHAGHEVWVQQGAGLGSGYSDDDYAKVGAKIVPFAGDVWSAEMVIKVKEPLPQEYQYFRPGLVLFTYLHLAAEKDLTEKLLEQKVQGVAYETITEDQGGLPLLRPMSEIAGRMSIQVGAASLEKSQSGKGILLSGVPGTRRGQVVILGGGVVGTAAARIAIGMGAKVTVLDVSSQRMDYLEDVFGSAIETIYSNQTSIEEAVCSADLVVGGVLIPGGAAPKLVDEYLLKKMQPGSVVVDVAVDQGGCISTCHPTTHDQPTYIVHDIVHYCVANMPGAVPRTSTMALTNATQPYVLAIANQGLIGAIKSNRHLANGINVFNGTCTTEGVANAHGIAFTPLEQLL